MSRIPNNHSKASWTIARKTERPESQRVEVSLRFQHKGTPMDYVDYVDSMIDCKRGYKGRHEEKGRPAGSRVIWDEGLQIFRLA